MKRLILSLFFVSTMFTVSFGDIAKKAGTTACPFLKIGVGARPVAMGETYTGVAEGINSIYWNSAGLALLENKEISAMHIEWFQGVKYEYLAYAQPVEKIKGIIGTNITYLYMGGIEKREDEDSDPEKAKAYDLALNLAYATQYNDKLSLGINFKFIRSFIVEKSAYAFASDVSALYKIKRNLKAGLAVQNIGTKMKFIDEADPLPLVIKGGVSYTLLHNPSLDRDALLLGLDVNVPFDNYINVHCGAEYTLKILHNMECALRIGYKSNTDLGVLSGFCSGLGLVYKSIHLDYAFVPYGVLGNTHRISLRLKL